MNSTATNNVIKVALLGNPNAGKSSLFNGLTGLNQKTGNYSGVTVDRYEGRTSYYAGNKKTEIGIVDLPGLYSLYPKSNDEEIACKTLLDETEKIDVVVIVADATSLKRNLLLATQLIDLKFKTVLVFNMIDEANAQGIRFDIKGLQESFGVEIVCVDSRNRIGFQELKHAIVNARASSSIFYDLNAPLLQRIHYRQLIGTALNTPVNPELKQFENSDKIYRFNVINYILAKYVKSPEQLSQKQLSARIDRFFTHKVFGYLSLLLILFLVFQLIFFISEAPMNWIEGAFLNLGEYVSQRLPSGSVNDLIVNGVIAGVSGVLMFIPQIAFLFLFIGILEDSGYMARASFIMDRLMRPFGLNGKSVIPLISGTACAVPSIMATRSISNVKERLITIFILPLISCSARLPVYTLIIAVMYPDTTFFGIFNSRGLVLFLLYMLGFAVSFVTAYFLKKIIKTKETSFFIMELPVYRKPELRNLALLVYTKVKVFVNEAGKIILAISVILWFLSSHGVGGKYTELEKQEKILLAGASDSLQFSQLKAVQTQKLEQSYIGQLGHLIEPVIRPLGFDWKIGIALLTSFAAREVFVGTMATIYQSNNVEDTEGIKQRLLAEKNADGSARYSPAVCWSLLLFYAFAMQCMSTIAVVKRETKSWLVVISQLVFLTTLAYLSSLTAYQLLS